MERRRSAPGRPPGLRVTDRDRLVLEFIAEHRLALAAHVQVLLGVSATAASRRLRALVDGGLLVREPVFHRCPPCYQVTRKGLALIGSDLPKARLDYRAYRHDVGVAWLYLAARAGAFGPLAQVVPERRMRSRDGVERHEARALGEYRERAPFGVPLAGRSPGGGPRLHYPDLVLVDRGGRRIAVELELTPKGRARRHRIIGAYAAERQIDAVLYLVEDVRVARAVQATARRFGFEQRVLVQPVRMGAGQVPGPSIPERAATRQRGTTRGRAERAAATL